jgi:hypothetical protein
MIIFDLSCSDNHRFEGWFRSAEDFESQQASGLVSCPHCGSASVRRLPSVLHLSSGVSDTHRQTEAPAPASIEAAHPLEALRAVVEKIVGNSEDVGNQFAAEARKIHYHEAPERAIRGQASDDDFSALKEEGIDVLRLPIIKPKDLN